MKHHSSLFVQLTLRGTAIGRQFGWGGTPAKKYHGRLMVASPGSELRGGVQWQKAALPETDQ